MAKNAFKRKVGVVTFNNEVAVLGDGSKPIEIITGDKLFDYPFLENNGKTLAATLLTQPIGETAKLL